MKSFKLLSVLLPAVAAYLLSSGLPSGEGTGSGTSDARAEAQQNTIVLIQFQARPDKGPEAATQLKALIEEVQNEPHFVSIAMHVDPEDDTQIMLYEEWADASYYKADHMETAHMKDFQANSVYFLTGPPEVTFWEVREVFE